MPMPMRNGPTTATTTDHRSAAHPRTKETPEPHSRPAMNGQGAPEGGGAGGEAARHPSISPTSGLPRPIGPAPRLPHLPPAPQPGAAASAAYPVQGCVAALFLLPCAPHQAAPGVVLKGRATATTHEALLLLLLASRSAVDH